LSWVKISTPYMRMAQAVITTLSYIGI